MYEAADAGIQLIVAITEGIPVLDMLSTYWKAKEAGVRLLDPNCPGALSPGKASVGPGPLVALLRPSGNPGDGQLSIQPPPAGESTT